jgi:hypothetical protein
VAADRVEQIRLFKRFESVILRIFGTWREPPPAAPKFSKGFGEELLPLKLGPEQPFP